MTDQGIRDRLLAMLQGDETLAVVGGGATLLLSVEASAEGDVLDRLEHALEALRRASSHEHLRTKGLDRGYRIEDVGAIIVRVASHAESETASSWLSRRVRSVDIEVIVDPTRPLRIGASFAPRLGPAPSRDAYRVEADGRLRVEAFEFHVTEHCNLRCASCCNMSPLIAPHTMTVDEVAALTERMARVVIADVFKIMGGEPLLHPEITEVLSVVRASGLGERVRLFTNGLLLKSMPDAFFAALDELTISNYASAPVRAPILALARARAKEHGFVLNVKDVTEFSHVLSPRFEADDRAVDATYRRCWLRHRCLIVRANRFYMCTRAAYADDFLARVAHDPVPDGFTLDRADDGVLLEGEDLSERLAAYMNRDTPLGACRYCFGGDGAIVPHRQLTRRQVDAGVLSPELVRPH